MLSERIITPRSYDGPAIFRNLWQSLVTTIPPFSSVQATCFYGTSSHFAQSRGCAVTRGVVGSWEVVLAEDRFRRFPLAKVQAVLRHEIGHIVDFSVPTEALNELAQQRGVTLPPTPERRADAIARLLWGDCIYYDPSDLIQTLDVGITPRPVELGL